jgi:hypothetical protein
MHLKLASSIDFPHHLLPRVAAQQLACRRGETTYAMGWLKEEPNYALEDSGEGNNKERHNGYPGLGLS